MNNSMLNASSSDTAEIATESRSVYIFTTLPVLAVVTSLFVAARFYNRIAIQRYFGLDDSLIAISLLCILLNTALQVYAAHHGIGRHDSALTVEQQTQSRFWYYTSSYFAVSGLGIPKMAVVSLVCRVFTPCYWHRCLLWMASILCTLQFFFATATFLMQCTPYYALWDVSIKNEVCRSPLPILYFRYYATSFGAFLDFYLALYPAIMFSSMGFSFRKKLALSLMLGLGVFATATAIYKATYLRRLSSPDFTWEILDLIVWTAVEGSLIVIAACVPMLHPVYEVFRAKISGPSQGSNDLAEDNGNVQENQGFWSLLIQQALTVGSRISATKSSGRTPSSAGRTTWEDRFDSSRRANPGTGEQTAGNALQNTTAWVNDVELVTQNGMGK